MPTMCQALKCVFHNSGLITLGELILISISVLV